jgi:hypothetical protein
MRIPEENCNMLLLAGVALVSAMIAGGATLLEPASAAHKGRPFYVTTAASSPSAVAASSAVATSPMAENKPARLVDQTPARVVGAPFVPNTNPRERH